jgi:hypothetical protein
MGVQSNMAAAPRCFRVPTVLQGGDIRDIPIWKGRH